MKLINPFSKRAYVNLFSDFVLQKLGRNTKTIVQVTLYDNFIIIYGKTDSKEVLDIDQLKMEFYEKNADLYIRNSIKDTLGSLNLIEYNPDYFRNNCYVYYLDLYNTERPLYHKKVLNFHFEEFQDTVEWKNELFLEVQNNSILPTGKFKYSPIQITSEFPYGHSLSLGRSLLYYAEHISHNIFNTISVEKMKFLITNQKNLNDEQIINLESKSPFPEEKIKSLILDNFDFDLEKFNEYLSGYDLADEITNVSSKKPWLIKNVLPQDLFIF